MDASEMIRELRSIQRKAQAGDTQSIESHVLVLIRIVDREQKVSEIEQLVQRIEAEGLDDVAGELRRLADKFEPF